MHKINFSKRAVEDLSDIWNYTAKKWSVLQADNYYNTLISFCKVLAKNPAFYGTKYDVIKNGLLGCKVEKHILFYIIQNNEVLIIRVLHEKMDYYESSKWK